VLRALFDPDDSKAGEKRDIEMSTSTLLGRTYNQYHASRKYVQGRRRFSIYVTWSYPAEANKDLTQLDNRFSTMTEVRRVGWPAFESPEYANPLRFQQGISGSLELFFRAWLPFQRAVQENAGHEVPVYQRVDQAGYELPLDERALADTDTLLVWGLDSLGTEQEPSQGEAEAVGHFLEREGTSLIIGPHHDVGASEDLKVRDQEYHHHGDALVPRQQRFGTYARSLMRALGIPVENRYGLRPATVKETSQIAPLNVKSDLDTRGFLAGVTTFSFHLHLPHYAVTTSDPKGAQVLATQPIDLAKPHPFTEEGNREFNSLVWVPPNGKRAGDVLVVDSTVFSTLFGGTESLERFWKNLATIK
jgi:hypothetical protein